MSAGEPANTITCPQCGKTWVTVLACGNRLRWNCTCGWSSDVYYAEQREARWAAKNQRRSQERTKGRQ